MSAAAEEGRPARVVCLEGPSAVGKTTLAAALAEECGAVVVPELSAGPPPPVGRSAAWFADRHAEQWRAARRQAACAPFAVLDGDPFKGLWYGWVYAEEGWEGVDVVAPLYRAHLERGTLGFPDLYVALDATEDQLRHHRASDPARRRRSFEKHLRLVEPLRRYFAALRALAPGRVEIVATADRAALVDRVTNALARLPAERPDPVWLLERMADWIRTRSPADGRDGSAAEQPRRG